MPLAVVDAAAKTDVGLVRTSNQDTFASDESLHLYIVCDGMGGPAGGEVASILAADTFLSIARQEAEATHSGRAPAIAQALERAAAAANRAVCNRAAYDIRFRGMGTTLVAAVATPEEWIVLNVGDSRAYLLRDGQLQQVSSDHSYLKEQVARGLMTPEQAALSPLQSVITRAIGAEADVHPDVFRVPALPGDTVLLCSDGLTRHVADAELAAILCDSSTAAHACDELIAAARHGGGSDNITAFVIRVTSEA